MRARLDSEALIPRRKFLGQTAGTLGAFLLLSEISPWFRRTLNRCYVERSFYAMGSIATVCAYGENREHLHQTVTRVIKEFQRLDDLLSVYSPASELSAINDAAGEKAVSAGVETITLLSAARGYHDATNGAFDATIEPLMRLWGFRGDRPLGSSVPTDTEIRETLEGVGMHQIEIDATAKTVGLKNSKSKLDFGGFAVGYAVDRAVAIMKSEGIESAFINHSGDAYALGAPEESSGWEVAIPDPLNRSKALATLELRDRAVATSGNYEKYVTVEERRYGHILDPATGFPTDAMLSATVVAPSALAADALSTGCFALGEAEAVRLVDQLEDVGVVSVCRVGGRGRLLRHGSV